MPGFTLPGSLRGYNRETFASDALAAVVVTIMLIPQSLAYALLAGLPAEMGLYASIVPLAVYALFGTSRTLSVGPVAVLSLMTASSVGNVAAAGTADYATAAVALAALSGLMLVLLGLLRFGFVANFLSHPVISGFITASGLLIGLSQLRHLLGIDAGGSNLVQIASSLATELTDTNVATVVTGIGALLILLWSRRFLAPLLQRFGLSPAGAVMASRGGPVLAIVATTCASYYLALAPRGVALVGEVPRGLPAFSLPNLNLELWSSLAVPALLISLIGFVESVSVGKTLAAKRRQRIEYDQELIALGAANIGAALSGGFPVTGGFARSVVNFDAGAQTQLASVMAAGGIALAAVLLTPVLHYLPKATLAATIIVAVSSLVDWRVLRVAWRFSRADFAAVAITISATLLFGVEMGVVCGVLASVSLHLHNTSRPHVAVIGAVPGTEHFRNVERHAVITYPSIVSLRVDESLYFANASFLENLVYAQVAERPELKHVILQCAAVNSIDLSAVEALEAIDQRLAELGITLSLSEVKGPVMDTLRRSDFLQHLSGKVYLTHHQAVKALKPDEIEPYIP